MQKILALISLLLILSSCSDEPKKTIDKTAKKIEKITVKKKKTVIEKKKIEKKKEVKKKLFPTLTTTTAPNFLRKYGQKHKERIVEISTKFGKIKIRLFNSTPVHTANFLMLTKRKYYDNSVFYRVVEGFVAQGGNAASKELSKSRKEIGKYLLSKEFRSNLIHKRGAVAMAREYENNPNKMSSAYNFYIVQGTVFNALQMKAISRQYNKKYTAEQIKIYGTLGGAPHLDGEHTVFGEVISGMSAVDQITKVSTDRSDWPRTDISMKVRVIR